MDLALILSLVERGIGIANALLTADNIAGAERVWASLMAIMKPPTDVTQADLDKVEAELDALLTEFDLPLPAGGAP